MIFFDASDPNIAKKLQLHFADKPVWSGVLDSQTILAQSGSTILPRTSLVRINHLPFAVSLAVHLSATSGTTPIGGPVPGGVPWFEVAFGSETSRYRYTCFAGIENVGGTSLEVNTVQFDTAGTVHVLKAEAWISFAPVTINVQASI